MAHKYKKSYDRKYQNLYGEKSKVLEGQTKPNSAVINTNYWPLMCKI